MAVSMTIAQTDMPDENVAVVSEDAERKASSQYKRLCSVVGDKNRRYRAFLNEAAKPAKFEEGQSAGVFAKAPFHRTFAGCL